MCYKRTLPILMLASLGLLILMGVLHGHPFHPSRPKITREPDAEASQLLKQAVTTLDPAHLTAVETNLWQRVRMAPLDFEVEGRYVLAPDARFRLELHTQVSTRTGSLLQVCDGVYLWQGTRMEGTCWQVVHRTPLPPPVLPPLPESASHDGDSDDPDPGRTFRGVYPLLCNLHRQLIWDGHEKTTLAGRECHLLTGTWKRALATALAPIDKPWPDNLPGQCRLWLDCRTCWPHRVEWLTPAGEDGTAPRLLAEMELRSPVFNPVLSETRCQAEFHFDPGTTPVIDPNEPLRPDTPIPLGR